MRVLGFRVKGSGLKARGLRVSGFVFREACE